MKPIVYVTQIPTRKDQETGQTVPSFNISPAAEHGEIRVLMPPTASFFATTDLIRQLRDGLKDYNFDNGDSAIALGDPSVIAVLGAVLAERNRSFNILKWDRQIKRYVKIQVKM